MWMKHLVANDRKRQTDEKLIRIVNFSNPPPKFFFRVFCSVSLE